MKKLTLLGTGSSMGIPVIGCPCPICHSPNPKNSRLRTSALLECEGKRFLIDAGPDFRTQALSLNLDHLDGVLFTHSHYDHVGGLDELRIFYLIDHKPLPCLLSEGTKGDLEKRWNHLFAKPATGESLAAQLSFQVLKRGRGKAIFEGLTLSYFTYYQGKMPVLGFRFGDLAYVSDIARYPKSIFEDLAGVKTLILSALRHQPSAIHFTVEEAVKFAEQVGAQSTYLVHIGHELDHEATDSALPDGVYLGFDGLTLQG